jgi:hypothetical protein
LPYACYGCDRSRRRCGRTRRPNSVQTACGPDRLSPRTAAVSPFRAGSSTFPRPEARTSRRMPHHGVARLILRALQRMSSRCPHLRMPGLTAPAHVRRHGRAGAASVDSLAVSPVACPDLLSRLLRAISRSRQHLNIESTRNEASGYPCQSLSESPSQDCP